MQKFKSHMSTSWPYLIFIAISLVMLPTSFLYRVSPIGDINTMLAMGNSLAHGVIPFIDLFEQRGPYMYLLHTVAALPGHSLHWVYLLELANFFVVYTLFRKIAELKTTLVRAKWMALAAMIFFLFSPTMWYGASPEEFCLIPVVYTIYVIFKYLSTDKYKYNYQVPNKQIFLVGAGLGWIVFLKYSIIGTSVGFFIGYGLYLLFKKQFKQFIKTVGVAFAGLATTALPVIIFYASFGKLQYFLYQYFVTNTGVKSRGLANILRQMGSAFISDMMNISVMLILLVYVLITARKLVKMSPKPFCFVLGTTVLFQLITMVMIMRVLPTYATPFLATLLALTAWALDATIKSFQRIKSPLVLSILMILQFGPVIMLAPHYDGLLVHMDTVFSKLDTHHIETDASYNQGRLIKANGGGEILALYDVPRAVYAGADSYPTLRHFDQTTISYESQPEAGDAQYRYMKNQDVVWVQTPLAGYIKPKDAKVEAHAKKTAENMFKRIKKSANSLYAGIDVMKMRPKHHPNDYYKLATFKSNGNVAYLPQIPKPLVDDYVAVDLRPMHKEELDMDKKNAGVDPIKMNRFYVLFTTKENARKHHLKPITMIVEK